MASPGEVCRSTVVGIHLFYCEDGRMKNLWVDLQEVHALAWCAGTIPERPGGTGGSGTPIPSKSHGPGPDCTKLRGAMNGDTPLCWWDGMDWVCGTE